MGQPERHVAFRIVAGVSEETAETGIILPEILTFSLFDCLSGYLQRYPGNSRGGVKSLDNPNVGNTIAVVDCEISLEVCYFSGTGIMQWFLLKFNLIAGQPVFYIGNHNLLLLFVFFAPVLPVCDVGPGHCAGQRSGLSFMPFCLIQQFGSGDKPCIVAGNLDQNHVAMWIAFTSPRKQGEDIINGCQCPCRTRKYNLVGLVCADGLLDNVKSPFVDCVIRKHLHLLFPKRSREIPVIVESLNLQSFKQKNRKRLVCIKRRDNKPCGIFGQV